MIQAFERWSQFVSSSEMPDEKRASGYLHQILKNLFIDGLRKRDRRGRLLQDNLVDVLMSTTASKTGNVVPDSDIRESVDGGHVKTGLSVLVESGVPSIERRSVVQAIRQAILGLTEDLREVAIRSYINDEPCEEIANAMGVTINTTKSRLRRARHRLLEVLAPERAPAMQLVMTA
jgi:RNA polymerase sigma factor (sigma-70 family)